MKRRSLRKIKEKMNKAEQDKEQSDMAAIVWMRQVTDDPKEAQMQGADSVTRSSEVNQQISDQPSTSGTLPNTTSRNDGEQQIHQSVFALEKETYRTAEGETGKKRVKVIAERGAPIRDLCIADNVTYDFRQMPAEQPTSQTRRDLHDALENLRKILKDYNRREFDIPVTEDYGDLKEPDNEVCPRLLELLRFYRGDLVKMMSQYQKEQVFKLGDESTLPGVQMDYKTFLKRVKETKDMRISVIGQAGSGKSVIMRRLTRDLTKQNNDLLIFFMNFKDFTNLEKITPCDFLFHGLIPKSDANLCFDWILENQDKVMLVLDGLDQATWNVTEDAKLVDTYNTGSVSEIVSSIFKGKLFPGVKVVYSSREHSVASLAGKLRPKMVVALTGLSPDDSELLFKSFVGKEGDELWETLRMQSYSIIPLLSIPAFLVFTAIVYVNKPGSAPGSMTEVLHNLLGIFMQSGHITEKDLPRVLTGLKKMSFRGLKDGKVIFFIIDVRNAGLDPEKIRDWIIKIPGLNKCNYFLLEGKYVLIFSHQIIQEFLAAQYIIEMDIESFKEVVMQYLEEDSWSVVTRFVSGMLLNDDVTEDLDTVSDVELKRNIFKSMLEEKWRQKPSLEVLSAISESNHSDFINDLIDEIYLSNTGSALGISDAYIIASILRHLSCLQVLCFDKCYFGSETLQIIWDGIEHNCPRISTLNLSYNNFESLQDFTIIGKLVNKCAIDSLELHGWQVSDEASENLLSSCDGATISKLNVSHDYLDEDAAAIFGDIVKQCSVEKLEIRDCGLSEVSCKTLLSRVSGAKISELDVSHNHLDEDAAAILGDIVKQCSVEILKICHCRLDQVLLKTLLSRVSGAKISKLHVSFNHLDEDAAAILGDIVKQCSVEKLKMVHCGLDQVLLKTLLSRASGAKISVLNVSGNDLDEDAAAVLGDVVKQCSVAKLEMWQCRLNKFSLKTLLSRVSGAKISELDDSLNYLDEDAAAILGDIVKQCSVEKLEMRQCGLSEVSLKTLLSRVSGAKISELNVSDNGLDEDTAAVLGDIVKHCSVEKLEIRDCDLSDVSLKTLLSKASGAKLSFIDVRSFDGLENKISKALLDEVSRSITVEQD